MNKSYITLSKTNIFNAVISINSKNEQKYYHKYKPEIGVNITANSIELHSIGSLTGKWKQEPFKIINYSEIEKIEVSICRRNYGAISGIIVNEYHIYLIIELLYGYSYQLETQSWDNFIYMIEKLKLEKVLVDDILNVYENYKQYRKKYFEKLDKTFDDIANQYHLDSYRSSNKRKGC